MKDLKKIGKIFLNNMTDIALFLLKMMIMIRERVKEPVVILWIPIKTCLVSR